MLIFTVLDTFLFPVLFKVMDNYYDPLAFTKQTASLLRGLGAPELIPECKKRNISTDILHQLSAQEFMILGADSQKAEEIRNALNVKKKPAFVVTSNQDRLQDFYEIIASGEKQLSLTLAFMTYWRLRLVNQRINIFVDPDKALSASEILPTSVVATLAELEEAQKNLSELEELVLRAKIKRKSNKIRRLCILVSGMGIVTLVLKTYLT